MDKFNFSTKIYEACSKDDIRPIMNCVHFQGGFLFASNGVVAVRQSLEYHSILQPENLEGASIHRESFKNILLFDEVTAGLDGVTCKGTDGREAYFTYFDRKGEPIPNFDSIFNSYKAKGVDFIGFNPDQMKILMAALYMPSGYVRVNFGGVDRGMWVDVPGVPYQDAIIVPVLIEGTLF